MVYRLAVAVFACALAACSSSTRTESPTAPSSLTTAEAVSTPTKGRDIAGAFRGSSERNGTADIAFPPRDEPFDFRQNVLEAKYRDQLRRPLTSTFVNIEGTIVWTQEYLRYRVNGCSHLESVSRVFLQIDGGGIAPVCLAQSGTAVFPPRTEPFDFRQRLEVKYRDDLRRPPTQTAVDLEGDIVWTQEYLRYRVSTCTHSEAIERVLAQIDGRGVQQDCHLFPTLSRSITAVDPNNQPVATFDFTQVFSTGLGGASSSITYSVTNLLSRPLCVSYIIDFQGGNMSWTGSGSVSNLAAGGSENKGFVASSPARIDSGSIAIVFTTDPRVPCGGSAGFAGH